MKKTLGVLIVALSLIGCKPTPTAPENTAPAPTGPQNTAPQNTDPQNTDPQNTAPQNTVPTPMPQRVTNRLQNVNKLYIHTTWEKLVGNVEDSTGSLQRLKTSTKRLCSKVIKMNDAVTIRVVPKAGYQWKYFTAKNFDGTHYKDAQKYGTYSAQPGAITINPGNYYMFGVKPTDSNTVEWATLDLNTPFLTIEVAPSWKQEQGFISKGSLAWNSSNNRLRSSVYRINSNILRVFPEANYEWKYWVADYDEASGSYTNARAGIIYDDKPRSIIIDRDKYYMFGVRKIDGSAISKSESSTAHLTFAEDKWRKELILRAKQLINITYKSAGYVPVAGSNEHYLAPGTYNYVANNDDLGTKSYGVIRPNTQYSGGPYSSVTWMNNIIGSDISFETFMTSLRNPNSLVNRLDLRNGSNRGGYYGTVCSGLVLYALGLDTSMTSNQMIDSDLFETLGVGVFHNYQMKAEDVEIGDILVFDGHVQIISKIVRGEDGKVQQVIVTEAKRPFAIETIYTVDNTQKADTSTHTYFHLHVGAKFDKKDHIYTIRRLKSRDDLRPYIPSRYVSTTTTRKLVGSYSQVLALDKGNRSNYIYKQSSNSPSIDVYLDSSSIGQLHVRENIELTIFGSTPPKELYLFSGSNPEPTVIDTSKMTSGKSDPIKGTPTHKLQIAPYLGKRSPRFYKISPTRSKTDSNTVSFRVVDPGTISLGVDGKSIQLKDYDSSLKPVSYLVGYYALPEPSLIKKWDNLVSYLEGTTLKRTTSQVTHRLSSNLFRTNYENITVSLGENATTYQWKYFEVTKSSGGEYEGTSVSSYSSAPAEIRINPSKYYMFSIKRVDNGPIDKELQLLTIGKKLARRHFISKIITTAEANNFSLDVGGMPAQFKNKDRRVIVHVMYRNALGRVANEKEFMFKASSGRLEDIK